MIQPLEENGMNEICERRFYGIDMNGEWNLISFFCFFLSSRSLPFFPVHRLLNLMGIVYSGGLEIELDARKKPNTEYKVKNAVKWVTGKQQ